MKRLLFLFLLMFNLSTHASGQGFDWEWMNPLPAGGRPRGLARSVVALDSTNGLLLGYINEIYSTSDRGASWQKLFQDVDDRSYIWNVVHTDNGTLFSVRSYRALPDAASYRLSGSTDLGRSWETIEDQRVVYGNPVLASNGRTVLCQLGESDALRLSVDQGAHWSQVNAPGDLTCAAISKGGLLAVGVADGRGLISRDSARTWIQAFDVPNRYVSAVTWMDSTLLCGTSDSTLTAFSRDGTLLNATKTGFRIWDIVRMGSALVVNTDAGVQRSIDEGNSWTSAELQPPAGNLGRKTVFDSTHAILSAERIFRTSDGGRTWLEAETNHSYKIQRIASTASPKCVGVTSDGEILTSDDRGVQWTVRYQDIGRVSDLCVVNDRVFIVSTDTTALLRSNDEGESWSWIPLESEDPVIALERISDRIVVALTPHCLFISNNSGVSWEEVSLPASMKSLPFRDVSFAAGMMGLIGTAGSHHLLTTNAGMTWSTINTPEHLNVLSVHVLESGDILLVGRNSFFAVSGICHSSDAGRTWEITFGYNSGIYWISDRIYSILRVDALQALAVGTDGLISWTEDGGRNWIRQAVLSPSAWHDATFVSNDEVIVIGDYARALQGRRDTTTPPVESLAEVPRHAILESYPQPAGETVTAVVKVHKAEEITIRVTDILGRIITTHSPVYCFPGERHLTLHLNDAKPGVYFLQLVSPEGVDTRPIVVVR